MPCILWEFLLGHAEAEDRRAIDVVSLLKKLRLHKQAIFYEKFLREKEHDSEWEKPGCERQCMSTSDLTIS